MNVSLADTSIKFIKAREIGGAFGSEILISFAAAVPRQIIETGCMEMIKIQMKNLMDLYARKYRNSQDTAPYVTVFIVCENKEINIKAGNMLYSDKVKVQMINEAFETARKSMGLF